MRLKICEVGEKDKIVKLTSEEPTVLDLLVESGKDNDHNGIELKYGYPLQTLTVNDDNIKVTLDSLGISNGEKIILKPLNEDIFTTTRPSVAIPRQLIIKKIPDDNSCLFHCLSLGIYGNMNYTTQLRKQISEFIMNHPEQYNDKAILDGKSIREYCQWIEDYNSWGGYIEICIIPQIYENVTIWICDILNDYIDKIGEGDQVIVLLYTGVHYDLLEWKGQYTFYNQDLEWLDKESHRIMGENKKTTFDSRRAQIKCNICNGIFTGESGISKHVMETSHSDFVQL
ncbi:ubiquitin thioesterase Otu1p [Monosporozyma servazzii]